ncbi:MAG: glycosyltransferase [Mycobacteriales bacterium]
MTQPLLSVITAAHPTSYRWLPQAGASLVEQDVSLQWVVVADEGDTAAVAEYLIDLPVELRRRTTVLATGAPGLGAAVARTMALASVQTRWLSVLDADDQWLRGGLDILMAGASSQGVSWIVGRCDGLTPEGRRPHLPLGDLAGRRIRRGESVRRMEIGPLPWHPCVMVAETAAVRAVGGWPPFPVHEDVALAAALGAVVDGFAVDEVVYLYRKWGSQQTTQKPGYAEMRARWRPLSIARAKQLAESWPGNYFLAD